MKTYTSKIILTLLMAVLFAAAEAQIIVKIRPAAPAYRVRPIAPSRSHVWIGGNYVWRAGQYVYTDGYWASPRPGHHWVEGHWKHKRGGWVWVPGHWRR